MLSSMIEMDHKECANHARAPNIMCIMFHFLPSYKESERTDCVITLTWALLCMRYKWKKKQEKKSYSVSLCLR